MTYRTAAISIARHHPVAPPTLDKVYGLFDGDRLVIYSPHRHDLVPAVHELNNHIWIPDP